MHVGRGRIGLGDERGTVLARLSHQENCLEVLRRSMTNLPPAMPAYRTGASHRKRLLLTGATGLLGEYLLRDLTEQQIPLVVLARGSRQYSAQQRIEAVVRRWERLAGRALPRPVVLQGDLASDSLGLRAAEARWVAQHCDGILHNAASLQFVAEDGPDGEPWRSNLAGTHHVLSFASNHRLQDFFQVSTAYVCGTRSGTILESETDVGQTFGNDYEASKCASEIAIREQQDRFRSVTFFRPGIITGDHLTGYTSTFHGMYTPMKIVASLMNLAAGEEGLPAGSLLQALGLGRADEKNFVPVDWVSKVIATAISRPAAHHQTYHLTADQRTNCELLTEVIHEEFCAHVEAQRRSGSAAVSSGRRAATVDLSALVRSFRDQMEVYRAYWRNDPVFDRSKGLRLLPDLPPPIIDRACLKRLCRYALRNNFGWPRPQLRTPESWASESLAAVFESKAQQPIGAAAVNLRVLGEGGGDFHILGVDAATSAKEDQQPSCVVVHGLAPGWCGQLTLSAETLRQLRSGSMLLRHAISSGQVVCQWSSIAGGEPYAKASVLPWLPAVEAALAGACSDVKSTQANLVQRSQRP